MPELGPRERIFEALLDLSVGNGYTAIDLAMVLERAGASRQDFDADFSGMEDCAIQLLDDFYQPAKRRIRAAYDGRPRWPDSLRAASYETLDWVLENPREVRFGAIELLSVGELARLRREAAFKDFVYMVDAGRDYAPDPAAVSDLTAEHIVGSLAEMLIKRLRDPPRDPRELVADSMYLAVLPYLGLKAAERELTIPPPAPESDDG